MIEVEQRHRRAGEVVQLDEFIAGVLIRAEVGRMIHHFADRDGADPGIGVGRAAARAEFADGRRAVRAERPRRHGRELHVHARLVAPEGESIFRRAKPHTRAVAGEVATGIRGVQEQIIAGGVEREERTASVEERVELGFVKDHEAAGAEHGAVGDAIAFRIGFIVGEIPAGEIHRASRGVEQFNGVLQRRIGVGEHLVDHDALKRQEIAATGRGGAVEARDAGGAIREPPFGDAVFLVGEVQRINGHLARREETDGFAARAEAEVHMVSALVRVPVREEEREGILPCADEGEAWDLVLGPVQQIISEEQAAERDGLGVGIVNLQEVIVVARGIGQPLVETEIEMIAQARGEVGRAGGRQIEHPTARSIGHAANGQVRRLNAEGDQINDRAAAGRSVDEINLVAAGLEAEAGVKQAAGVGRGG